MHGKAHLPYCICVPGPRSCESLGVKCWDLDNATCLGVAWVHCTQALHGFCSVFFLGRELGALTDFPLSGDQTARRHPGWLLFRAPAASLRWELLPQPGAPRSQGSRETPTMGGPAALLSLFLVGGRGRGRGPHSLQLILAPPRWDPRKSRTVAGPRLLL